MWIHHAQRPPSTASDNQRHTTGKWQTKDGAPNFRLRGDWCDEVIDRQDVGHASSLARCSWRTDRSAAVRTKMDVSSDLEHQWLVAQQQRKVQSPHLALVVMRKDEVAVGKLGISPRRRFPV